MKKYLTPEVLAALSKLPTTDAPAALQALATTPEALLHRAQALEERFLELSIEQVEADLQATFDDDPQTVALLPLVPAEMPYRYTYVYVNQELMG